MEEGWGRTEGPPPGPRLVLYPQGPLPQGPPILLELGDHLPAPQLGASPRRQAWTAGPLTHPASQPCPCTRPTQTPTEPSRAIDDWPSHLTMSHLTLEQAPGTPPLASPLRARRFSPTAPPSRPSYLHTCPALVFFPWCLHLTYSLAYVQVVLFSLCLPPREHQGGLSGLQPAASLTPRA